MKEKKSVVYIGYDIPDGDASSIRVFSNACAIKEYGFDVYILSFDKDYSSTQFNIDNCSEINGVHVIRAKMPEYKSFKGLKFVFGAKTIIQAIDQLKIKIKIGTIIAYNHPSFSYDKLVRYAKKNGIRIVSDCTEWHSAIHYKGLLRLVKEIEISKGMNDSYKRSDGIICISRPMQKFFSKQNTLLVPPLQYEKYKYDINNENSQTKTFIYAGIPGTDKDRLDLIISAFEKINKPYRLDIFGITVDDYFHIFKIENSRALRIKNNKKVVFHGKVLHKDVIKKLAHSDFSLIIRDSSRKNDFGFPTKYAESISLGVPVIVSNFSDVSYYTQKYNLGYCVDDNDNIQEVLNKAIEETYENIAKLKDNCKETKIFSYDTYCQKIGSFIMQL